MIRDTNAILIKLLLRILAGSTSRLPVILLRIATLWLCSCLHCLIQMHLCRAIKCKWIASCSSSCTIFGRQSPMQLFRSCFNIFNFIGSFMRHTPNTYWWWVRSMPVFVNFNWYASFKRNKLADTHDFWLLIWKMNKTNAKWILKLNCCCLFLSKKNWQVKMRRKNERLSWTNMKRINVNSKMHTPDN